MSKYEHLLKSWESMGNQYGTEEGGWKTIEEAREAIQMVEETGIHVEDDFGIIGRLSDEEGWEPAHEDMAYTHFALTSNDGEYVLQPGEDDGERTEEGVKAVTPPKGWEWVFVA